MNDNNFNQSPPQQPQYQAQQPQYQEQIVGNNNVVRFLLIWFLWFIGSIIINYSTLRPTGYKSRTLAIAFLGLITIGIYNFIVAICNLFFDPAKPGNIGYHKVNF